MESATGESSAGSPAPGVGPDEAAAYLRAHPHPAPPRAVRSPVRSHVTGRAGRLTLAYAGFAGLWIVASSWVTRLVPDEAGFELVKGLFFVAATAGILFAVLVAHGRAAEESSLRMRHLIESSGDVAFRYRVHPTVGFEYISARAADWFGITAQEFVERPDVVARLVHPSDRDALIALLMGGTTSHSMPLRHLTPDGRLVHTLHDVREVLDRRGRAIAVDGRIRNVTEERRNLAEAAITEGIMTGLEADHGADAVAQRVCDLLVALMEVDRAWIGVADDDGGVRVLASTGGPPIDQRADRWDDGAAGYGPAGAAIRERRPVTMAPELPGYAPWRQRAMEVGVTAALGVPILRRGEVVGVLTVASRFGNPFDQAHVDRFERTAERLSTAMATVSRSGRVPRLTAPALLRRTSFDVVAALADGRVEPWWQPQVCARTGRIVALEALVRGRTPGGELVLPLALLPAAEEAGQMVALGRALRRQIVHLAPRLFGLGVDRIAINASVAELAEPAYALELVELLDDHRVPRESIEVEIIETAPLDSGALRTIGELARSGIRVAVDDYGSGWASLGHLARVPATTLKIDRTFVRDLGTAARADQLVRSTFELARSLDLSTVAEGVETAEQARVLREMGCDAFQGFLFSAPLPAPEIARLLSTGPRLGTLVD
ncbi:MAG: EAL domain-containing protein [Ilumatobacteraceae bacterium]